MLGKNKIIQQARAKDIISYHNAATFQKACFQLQRNNQKHATVIWQLKKIKVVCEKESKKHENLLTFDLRFFKPFTTIMSQWLGRLVAVSQYT